MFSVGSALLFLFLCVLFGVACLFALSCFVSYACFKLLFVCLVCDVMYCLFVACFV